MAISRLILTALFIGLGLTALIAGAVIMFLNTGNDSEGYVLSESYTVDTSANAFALMMGSPVSGAQIKWVVSSADSNKEIFAGWGPVSTVTSYIRDYKYAGPQFGWSYVSKAYLTSIDVSSLYIVNQNSPALPPSQDLSIWQDKVTTTNSATLTCTPNSEDGKVGMLVIMNTDGSNGVHATIQLGAKIAFLGWLPYLLIPLGLVLLVIGLLLTKRKKQ